MLFTRFNCMNFQDILFIYYLNLKKYIDLKKINKIFLHLIYTNIFYITNRYIFTHIYIYIIILKLTFVMIPKFLSVI